MHSSAAASQNHYRCNACGNIWSEPKVQKSSRLVSFR
jgi:hypothetical protein